MRAHFRLFGPSNIQLRILAKNTCDMRFYCLCQKTGKRIFDRFPVELNAGSNRLEFPMPIAPNRIMIVGEMLTKGSKAKLSGKSVSLLQVRKPLGNEEGNFIQLAKMIANGSKKMPYKKYRLGSVEIAYLPKIVDDFGKRVETPARVDIYAPMIEIDPTFFAHTVAMRMFILCHEFGHYMHNTLDELLADKAGAELYLKSGFPASEAFYALTDVLGPSLESDARLAAMGKNLASYV